MRAAALALIALAACAATSTPPEARQPPLPQPMLDIALGPTASNDGGSQAQFLAMLGREDLFEQAARETCPAAEGDPVAEIVRQSAGRRVVIINEAHERPQHRAFIQRVATALRDEGFSIYAAETFMPPAREARAWPSVQDGFYSNEPVFGAALRHLRAQGYRFFQYEDMSPDPENASGRERIARREAGQSANLQRILAENPNARILVHAGFDHLLEEPDRFGNNWMARRLKEATGIDPLTIDQVEYASPNENFVLCDSARTRLRSDIAVGSPNLRFADARPAYRYEDIRTVRVARIFSAEEDVIWEARLLSEPDDAVPIDRVLLRPGEDVRLLLPSGRFRLEYWTRSTGYVRVPDINVP